MFPNLIPAHVSEAPPAVDLARLREAIEVQTGSALPWMSQPSSGALVLVAEPAFALQRTAARSVTVDDEEIRTDVGRTVVAEALEIPEEAASGSSSRDVAGSCSSLRALEAFQEALAIPSPGGLEHRAGLRGRFVAAA